MSPLKKITKLIVNIFTYILLVILICVIYGKLVITFGNNVYPNYFGYTFFEVASGSMKPALQVNDVILVKITNEDLKKGDIIAFQSEDAVITHRILYIDGNIITVKGDNNNIVDKPISKDQVIGKIVKIIPKLGVWKKVIVEPKILLSIFITLLLFDFALSYNRNDKKKKKEIMKKEKEDDADEVIVKEIVKEDIVVKPKEENKKKNITESEQLLELTRKIDVAEINKLLEGTEYKLEKREISNLKKKIDNKQSKEDIIPKLNNKEKKFVEYTMRLDLSEIQKKINSKVK